VSARILATAVGIAVAFTQSYERTQVFGAVIGVLVLISFVPQPAAVRRIIPAIAAGLCLFAGIALLSQRGGAPLATLGALAGLAELALSAHRRQSAWPSVAGLFGGAALMSVVVVAIALRVEG
jgi:hypothetical protein